MSVGFGKTGVSDFLQLTGYSLLFTLSGRLLAASSELLEASWHVNAQNAQQQTPSSLLI